MSWWEFRTRLLCCFGAVPSVLAARCRVGPLFYLIRGKVKLDHGAAAGRYTTFQSDETLAPHWLLAQSFYHAWHHRLAVMFGRKGCHPDHWATTPFAAVAGVDQVGAYKHLLGRIIIALVS